MLKVRLLQLGVLAATAKYPLSASAERAFANFRDKKHRILQLQIFATKKTLYFTITNFATKYCSFLQLHENKHFHGAGVDSPALVL